MKLPFLPRVIDCTRIHLFAIQRFWIVLLMLSALARAVDTPTAAPNGGTFTTFQTVTLSCTTSGATIYYTLNGLDPTTTDSNVGTGGTVQIPGPATLKVKAILGTDESAVQTAIYNITGQVSTSGSHTLILRADGTVWATGLNSFGQLGDGTSSPYQNKTLVSQVVGLSDIVAVAAGGNHSLALKRDGTVWAWGASTNSQCGYGNGGSTPRQVGGLTHVTKICAGLTHSVALTSDSGGSVYTWGGGASGQQGNSGTTDRATPDVVLTGVSDIASSATASHTLALLTGGTVKCWGSNSSGQCGGYPTYSPPVIAPALESGVSGIVAVGAGSAFSFGIKSDGTVMAWGQGYSVSYSLAGQIAGLSNVQSIVGGADQTLVLKTDGTVVVLGSNGSGELGLGTTASASSPTALTFPDPVTVLAAGGQSSCAIMANGTVMAWGNNTNGALGLGGTTQKNVPVQLLSSAIPDAVVVAAGGNHNVMTSLNTTATDRLHDEVLTWGSNSNGELGTNTTASAAAPGLISGISPLYASGVVAAGIDTSFVVKPDGTLWATGSNTYGQLARPSSVTSSKVFAACAMPSGVLYKAVAAGRWHALGLTTTGTLYSWGYGVFGQLGNDTGPIQQYTPVAVSSLTNVAAIAAGEYHSLALKTDGTVWAWGFSGNSQLGNTTSSDKKVPNQVGLPGTALTGVTSIAAGLIHSLAAKSDGTVAAWGDNSSGQLGDNTTTLRSLPIIIPSFTGVVQVAAGYSHSIALKSDGTVWAWGRNVEGQLGDGTNTQRNVPVQVAGLSDVVAIVAGDYHNVALKADGSLATWGSNSLGQLGTGVATAQLSPTGVVGINVLYASPGVAIDPPSPNTFAVGDIFTLHVTFPATHEAIIGQVHYLSDGQPLTTSDGSEDPPFSTSFGLGTWGDFHISATAFDVSGTPSFPSAPVLIHILPPISLNATLTAVDTVHLTWTAAPVPVTSYQVERILPDQDPILVTTVSGTSASDTLTFNPACLYKIIGLNGTQQVAMSPEVSVAFVDTDGDGLPDVWETAWGLDPNDPTDASEQLIGDGATALELFNDGASIASVTVGYPSNSPQFSKPLLLQLNYNVRRGGYSYSNLSTLPPANWQGWASSDKDWDEEHTYYEKVGQGVSLSSLGAWLADSDPFPNYYFYMTLPLDENDLYNCEGEAETYAADDPDDSTIGVQGMLTHSRYWLTSINPVSNTIYRNFTKIITRQVSYDDFSPSFDTSEMENVQMVIPVGSSSSEPVDLAPTFTIAEDSPDLAETFQGQLAEIQFTTSDITKGFDYPMDNDPPVTNPFVVEPPDGIAPEWWTSVGEGPTWGPGLQVNTHVLADIGSDLANYFVISVNPVDTSMVTLASAVLTGPQTELTITGLDGIGPTPHVAEVEITDKSIIPQVIRTLDVACFPRIDVPVRICYVYDPTEDPTPDEAGRGGRNPTRVAEGFQITQQIINHLNNVFRQACVQFFADSSSGEWPVSYDLNRNGNLDYGGGDLMQDAELQPFVAAGQFNRYEPTIFVVRNFQKYISYRKDGKRLADPVGLTMLWGNAESVWAFVSSDRFRVTDTYDTNAYLNVCAHEIGHIMRISTRNYGGPPSLGYTPDQHDGGPFPLRYDNTLTLMNPYYSERLQDVWIRHEDWFRANQTARGLVEILQ